MEIFSVKMREKTIEQKLVSAAKNMGKKKKKMAAIYEKYGNDAIPVIEVEPLRTGDIIVQEGVTLKFVKDVR